MTTAVSDAILTAIAQHAVDGNYHYSDQQELKLLISNKLGHDIPEKEVKIVEKHIKEIRAGH
jgi:hypothetical protein